MATSDTLALQRGEPRPRSDQARGERGATLREIEAVYTASAPRLRRVAAGIIGDADAAQDVVQEAFARAIRDRGSFTRTGPLEAWVWRVVVNTALNGRRAAAADAARNRRLEPPAPTDAEEAADRARIRSLIAALSGRQRAALFLHYYADLDYESIGRILRIRPGTVGKLLHDARAAMREDVER